MTSVKGRVKNSAATYVIPNSSSTYQAFLIYIYIFFFMWRCDPTRVMASSFLRFLDHTQGRTTVGRTPLDEWSARRRNLYLTTHNTQQTNIHAPGGIRTRDLSKRVAADLRLRPRGYWYRQMFITVRISWKYSIYQLILVSGLFLILCVGRKDTNYSRL